MESFYRYYLASLKLSREEFVAVHRDLFLLKPPSATHLAQSADEESDEDDEEPTREVDFNLTSPASDREPDALATEWRVAPIRKRPGYPPYNRIVVGRSTVCDVVLPFAPISKMHGNFHIENHRVARYSDRRSVNGSVFNGRRLAPEEPVPIAPGDKLRLGSVSFEIRDANGFFTLLSTM